MSQENRDPKATSEEQQPNAKPESGGEDPEKYARRSHGMRSMATWQLYGITIVVVVLVAAGLIYAT